jgi:hypothetical protein
MTAGATRANLVGAICPRVRAPSIADDVREYVAAEIAAAGGVTELSFGCGWDPETKTITSATLLWRGAEGQVPGFLDDLREGEIAVHNHPHTVSQFAPLVPSTADLDCAVERAKRGVGSAIVDRTASALYVIREPIRPRLLRELDAMPRMRYWSWRWRRFSLMYELGPIERPHFSEIR